MEGDGAAEAGGGTGYYGDFGEEAFAHFFWWLEEGGLGVDGDRMVWQSGRLLRRWLAT